MNKTLLCGLLGMVLGAGIGAGVLYLIGSRHSPTHTLSEPNLPEQAELERDPVLAAFDAVAFFKHISGKEDMIADFCARASGGLDYIDGAAVWQGEPMDAAALQQQVDAAIKSVISAGGGDRVTVAVDGHDAVTAGTVEISSHRQHSFACSYYVKIGGRVQLRHASVWVTAPLHGTQYSASLRFGN